MKRLVFFFLEKWTRFNLKNKAIFFPSTILGPRAKVSNAADKFSVSFGKNTSFYGRIINGRKGKVIIGDNTTIRFNSIIESAQEVFIGNDVIISNNVIISDNDSHPTDSQTRRLMSRSCHNGELWSWDHAAQARVEIQDNVWIGRNVMVMKGVTIGEGSIVASGTVVTKDIPAYSLCFGNPCVIKADKYRPIDE